MTRQPRKYRIFAIAESPNQPTGDVAMLRYVAELFDANPEVSAVEVATNEGGILMRLHRCDLE